MRNVLYITTRLFWPPVSGRQVSLYNYCKGLHDLLGYQVHVYSFLEKGQSYTQAADKPDFIESVKIAKPISKCEMALNLARAMADKTMPLQSCLYYSRANAASIRSRAERIDADIVIIDMVRLASYADILDEYDCAVVQNFDDLLSERYKRQIGEKGGNILGLYADNLPIILNKFVNGIMKDILLSKEARRLALAENRYARSSDAVLLISPKEALELASRAAVSNCFYATMGCDIGALSVPTDEKEYDLGFVGNMNTAANQAALRYIVDDILPSLPGRTLRVIGVCPDGIIKRYEGNGHISFSGRVDSIVEHLSKCQLLLAPFVFGTGIKTKVIEAMGLGIPVVTNSIGLEGIAAKPGKDVMCADTTEGLIEAVIELCSNPDKRKRIAEGGKAYVADNHTWEKSIENLGKCIDFAVSSHASVKRK